MIEEKWVDEDDQLAVPEHDVRLSSRKIWRKKQPLGKGLRDVFHKHKIAADAGWTQRAAPATTTVTQRQLLSARSLRVEVDRAWTVRKLFQTDHADTLRSVVQTIDVAGDLVAYAGLDKVLHFIRLDDSALKHYTPQETIYIEGLGALQAQFLDPARMICSFYQKSFVGLLDIPSKRLVNVHKLSQHGGSIAGVALHPRKQLSLLHTDKEGCLLDTRTELVTHKSLYAQKIRAACFVSDNIYAAIFGDARVRLFDIRKSLTETVDSIGGDFLTIAGAGNKFACGGRGGIAKLYELKKGIEAVKTFSHLTTDIGQVALNDDYLVFASAWKRNGVRIADVRSLRIMPIWPNVKTNLGTIKSACLTPANQLLVGNSLGHVHFYEIKD